MTIFLMPSLCNKSSAFVFLIYQLPSILLTTPSYSIVFSSGLAFPLFHYNGSLHISHPAHLLLGISPHNFHSSPLTCRVLQGTALGPVLFNLYTTPLSSVMLPYLTSYMLMTNNSVSFVPKNFSSLSLSSHLGCLLIILLSIHLKLNSFL